MAQKKIGIMGGPFDPVHIGHLILGEAAYQQFGLNSVWFMPAGNPPHKQNRTGRAGTNSVWRWSGAQYPPILISRFRLLR